MSKPLEPNTHIITWEDFKSKVSEHIKSDFGGRICRGQSNSNWPLMTSYHRNPCDVELPAYFKFIEEHMADVVGTVENRRINHTDKDENGAFLAYLQHHGFPTPLLDWTYSTYIAAYFAFSDVNDQNPASDYISIFVFDYYKWSNQLPQISDYNYKEPHVSILRPKILGNKRQHVQQASTYTWTNVADIGKHIRLIEKNTSEKYLEVYNISIQEKYHVMSELEMMGITSFSLFGTVDSLCRFYKDMLFRRDNNGVSTYTKLIERIQKINPPK